MSAFALRARYLLPVTAQPMAGGVVTIADGRIVAVGENTSGKPPIDLGDVALLPGLVNCHSHLEFSDLATPLGRPGMSMPDWIRCVLAARSERTQASSAAIARGIDESLECGTTLIGEIATSDWTPGPFAASPLDANVYFELMALSAERQQMQIEYACTQIRSDVFADSSARLSAGVSPHAPYTASLDMVREAALLGPTAMHVAESQEELELLACRSGPFRDLLSQRGLWRVDSFATSRRPLEYLHALAIAPRTLVIHGNYLDHEELAFLAARRATMSLVYCPRTHHFFAHEAYPLAVALNQGVRVALGTDSRASNPDLSLLAEMRFVAREFNHLDPKIILAMGTIAGAEALGRDDACGSIEVGKQADLVAVNLGCGQESPEELLLAHDGGISSVWVRGELVRCSADL
ncbi:MAG: amidohydrolase family protein [Planctomycetales bacterium]|nr:amidohydrolase family protein [Planctomycetales bacterium]